MKTNFFKQIVPVAAFAIAIGGAFSTHASEQSSKKLASVPGYQLIGGVCTYKNDCNDIVRPQMCTVGQQTGTPQLFGIHPVTGQCNVPLWRLP